MQYWALVDELILGHQDVWRQGHRDSFVMMLVALCQQLLFSDCGQIRLIAGLENCQSIAKCVRLTRERGLEGIARDGTELAVAVSSDCNVLGSVVGLNLVVYSFGDYIRMVSLTFEPVTFTVACDPRCKLEREGSSRSGV